MVSDAAAPASAARLVIRRIAADREPADRRDAATPHERRCPIDGRPVGSIRSSERSGRAIARRDRARPNHGVERIDSARSCRRNSTTVRMSCTVAANRSCDTSCPRRSSGCIRRRPPSASAAPTSSAAPASAMTSIRALANTPEQDAAGEVARADPFPARRVVGPDPPGGDRLPHHRQRRQRGGRPTGYPHRVRNDGGTDVQRGEQCPEQRAARCPRGPRPFDLASDQLPQNPDADRKGERDRPQSLADRAEQDASAADRSEQQVAHVGRLDRHRSTIGAVEQTDPESECRDHPGDRWSPTEDGLGSDRLVDQTVDRIGRKHDGDRPDECEQVDAVEDVEPLGVTESSLTPDSTQVAQDLGVGLDVLRSSRCDGTGVLSALGADTADWAGDFQRSPPSSCRPSSARSALIAATLAITACGAATRPPTIRSRPAPPTNRQRPRTRARRGSNRTGRSPSTATRSPVRQHDRRSRGRHGRSR